MSKNNPQWIKMIDLLPKRTKKYVYSNFGETFLNPSSDIYEDHGDLRDLFIEVKGIDYFIKEGKVYYDCEILIRQVTTIENLLHESSKETLDLLDGYKDKDLVLLKIYDYLERRRTGRKFKPKAADFVKIKY